MRLTILGTSTPYPRPDNPCSGYLVQSDAANVWVDAGTGTLAELQRYLELDRLDAIWISHGHADHTADLLATYYALRFADLELAEPIPLLGPPGLLDRMAEYLGSNSRALLPTVLNFSELGGSGHRQVKDLSLSWLPVRHGVPAFGLRMEAPDAVLAYSGDTTECPEVVELAAGAQALLCEVGADGHSSEARAHTTPEEAGGMASIAGAGSLILTHVSSRIGPETLVSRAATAFAGNISIAQRASTYDLRRP